MTDKIKKSIPILFSAVMVFSGKVDAEEYSPYSPAFILKPAQIESSSSFGMNWANAQFSSPLTNNSSKIGVIGAGEAISVGLPQDIEIGAGIGYSDYVNKSPATLNVVTGWSNPSMYANKTWFSNTNIRLKAGISVIPRTGGSGLTSFPTQYIGGVTGIYIGSNDWVSTLYASQTISDKNGNTFQLTDSTLLRATLSKAIDSYLIEGSFGATRSSSMIYEGGAYLQPSYTYLASLQASRQIVRDIWAAISYEISTNQNTVSGSESQYNTKILNNSITASVRMLF